MTPTLDELIIQGIRSELFDVNTCLPCIVDKYDFEKQTVDVIPAIKRKYSETKIVQMPPVLTVPVMFPRTADFSITHPIAKGDAGFLVFSQRSIDVWKEKGGIVESGDTRMFNLSDAIFWPGGSQTFEPIEEAEENCLIIAFKEAKIKIDADGKINIEGGTGEELLNLVKQIADALAIAQTAAGPLFNAADFVAISAKIDGIKA